MVSQRHILSAVKVQVFWLILLASGWFRAVFNWPLGKFFFQTDPATLTFASLLNIHWIFTKVLLKDHCLLMSQQYKTYSTDLILCLIL